MKFCFEIITSFLIAAKYHRQKSILKRLLIQPCLEKIRIRGRKPPGEYLFGSASRLTSLKLLDEEAEKLYFRISDHLAAGRKDCVAPLCPSARIVHGAGSK